MIDLLRKVDGGVGGKVEKVLDPIDWTSMVSSLHYGVIALAIRRTYCLVNIRSRDLNSDNYVLGFPWDPILLMVPQLCLSRKIVFSK